MQEGVAILQALAAEFPVDCQIHIELAQAHNILGLVLQDAAQRQRAAAQFAEAFEEFRVALQVEPGNPRALGLMAWFLAIHPTEKFSDPAFAVECARKAVEREPGNGMWWNMLALSGYRSGKYGDALRAIERAAQLHAGGDSLDWFLLAMIHYKLGHRKEAEDWYAKGLQWRADKNHVDDRDLLRFRAEADELFAGAQVKSAPKQEKEHAR